VLPTTMVEIGHEVRHDQGGWEGSSLVEIHLGAHQEGYEEANHRIDL